jgi:hypothetical protein
MKNDPFLVVNIIDGDLGRIYSYDLYSDALECAAQLAAEQCNVSIADATDELETESSYYSPDGYIRIYITQADE